MTRENRVNVIFLSVLALLMAPGFVILMSRKLSGGGGKSNARPDPVASAISYMQPLPAPPVPRAEPRRIRDWVAGMIHERLGQDARTVRQDASPDSLPVVSDRFVTQFAGFTKTAGGKTRLWLIVWEDAPDLHANPPMIEAGGFTATARPPEIVDMPIEMRHSLQDTGWVDPPPRIAWLNADLPAEAASADSIALTRHVAGRDVVERITLPKTARPATEPSR
ncbi:MAG: hypothetical protein QM754_13215 [Tepidisphaeraceae bacterium]